MTEDLDHSLNVDILAAALSLEQQDSGALLELLARKFSGGLPQNTKVRRRWFGLGSIRSVTLCFGDREYAVSQEKYGALSTRSAQVVRGITIKTTNLSMAEWSQAVAEVLSEKAALNADVRASLNRFILGDPMVNT